jgi:glucose-1-phosphate cytidylyltransferase
VKVVIFCGGLGVRMGEESTRIPKPMIPIGNRPILWHIMAYYAAWGHREFILCLGHKGAVIKDYFERSGALTDDAMDWEITFADTGIESTIAERLKAVEDLLGDDESFLATYGDGLTDAPLNEVIARFEATGKMVQILSVRPNMSLHTVTARPDGTVTDLVDINASDIRINGGFFVCRRELLDWIEPGDELVVETFGRLMARGEVVAYRYDGFFEPMDTMKDRQRLEALHATGSAPWSVVGLAPVGDCAP